MLLYVGCSANDDIKEEILKDCEELLDNILKENDLIFGACNHGIMGLSYQIAKKNNRKVIGVCPIEYQDSLKEIECDEEIITKQIQESTTRIIDTCDAIIILPGGFGSIYELFTTLYRKICHEHDKKIIIYNSLGYYDDLVSFIENMYNNNFAREKVKDNYFISSNKDEIIDYLKK